MEKLIEFKGMHGGIVLQIKPYNQFEDLLNGIRSKLEKSKDFFVGANIVGVKGAELKEPQRVQIYSVIHNEFGLSVESLDSIDNKPQKKSIPEIAPISYDEFTTKIVKTTLRSGKSIDFDGNVIIIGDVNPGAEVIADGNIIIMGNLRGLAHAGRKGDPNTYVIAEKMQPTQLRIADMITRSPDNVDANSLKREIAFLKDGQMHIREL